MLAERAYWFQQASEIDSSRKNYRAYAVYGTNFRCSELCESDFFVV